MNDKNPIRPNPVRARLNAGGTAFGTMAFEFFSPGLPAVLAAAGADYCVFDMEHSGASIDTMRMQLAACRGLPLVPIVRVPGAARHLISPVLDAGAMGIMVPMVETRAQAEAIVSWCRYRPEGERGLAFSVAHDDFAGGDAAAKMAAENVRTLVIPLIETATGIENVEAILSVPGIDLGWLGHFDLTDSMGIAAQFDHPRFLAAVDRLLAACRANNKAASVLAGDVATGRAWLARGFRSICYSTDIGLLKGALRDGITALRAAT